MGARAVGSQGQPNSVTEAPSAPHGQNSNGFSFSEKKKGESLFFECHTQSFFFPIAPSL
jgi:hypothetical protein